MPEFRVTETWKMFVTVEAETPEEAEKIGQEMLHKGQVDDAEYEGSEDDGVELLSGEEFQDELGCDKTFWRYDELQ